MLIRFCWLMVSLLIFCRIVLSIVERGVLKSLTIIVEESGSRPES